VGEHARREDRYGRKQQGEGRCPMKTLIKITFVLASLALVACDKPQDAKPTDPATPATTAQATTATNTATNTPGAAQAKAGEPVTIADSDLVTPADYESAAETTITAKNYKTEIASLEAELNKE
jgi:hypothetical protein